MFTIECVVCGEVLKTKDAVRAATFNNDHMRMHTGERLLPGPNTENDTGNRDDSQP